MESVGLMQFNGAYSKKNILITGHTGFKGSWLSLWLSGLNANLTGISLPPERDEDHINLLEIDMNSYHQDISDYQALDLIFSKHKPEIVFHLAAQPLVRYSYNQPLETWRTNVIGTANILELARKHDSVRAVVVVTTDKCYLNKEWEWGYRENDRLGGNDPYSASKAATELLADSYRKSFFNSDHSVYLATARSGNVVGGGDWSNDRLIPDAVKALNANCYIEVRNPKSTRPWLHVLDTLQGYLLLGERMLDGDSRFCKAWNFGPDISSNVSVEEILTRFYKKWGSGKSILDLSPSPREARYLYLDSTLARVGLTWAPIWDIDSTILKTAKWYMEYTQKNNLISQSQLEEYFLDAAHSGAVWVNS
jgi:CDP-glucose 4,6-dehydratase